MRSKFVKDALRQLDYTNYSAIADIIDNSLEPDVDAHNIYVDIEAGKGEISKIFVSDDGLGMDAPTLEMAMCLGSETGKIKESNLGCYGAGMKTAAISIGTKLSVYTKTKESDEVLCACLDLDYMEEDGSIKVRMVSYSKEEKQYGWFVKCTRGSDNGTVVVIQNLDKIQYKRLAPFEKALTRELRMVFNKFIEKGDKSFFVNGKKLSLFDISYGCESFGSGSFTYSGVTMEWRAWYISVERSKNDGGELERTMRTCGIYIYRQNRLVGRALDLGMCKKSSNWANGLRFELFVDGNADSMFGSTFSKTISDNGRNRIDDGLYNIMFDIVNPLANEAIRRQKVESKEDSALSEEEQAIADSATERMNKNKAMAELASELAYVPDPEGEPCDEGGAREFRPSLRKVGDDKEHDEKEGASSGIKGRKSRRWFGGYKFESGGKSGDMFNVGTYDGLKYVIINTDHNFYRHIFKELGDSSKALMCEYLCCMAFALEQSGYYRNPDVARHINEYIWQYSEVVRKKYDEDETVMLVGTEC